MDKVPNAWISELCGVTEEMDERIDEGVLAMWREGRIDTVKDYLIKRCLDVG